MTPKRISITPALHEALNTVGPRLSAANRACAIIGLYAGGHDVRPLQDEIGQLLTEPLSTGIKMQLRSLFLTLMQAPEARRAPPLLLPGPAAEVDEPSYRATIATPHDPVPASASAMIDDPLGDLGDLGLSV